MPLVAGVDSSTQSCKVVIRDAETGELQRTGSAAHPDGTSVDPAAWWDALREATDAAGGFDDVDSVAVGGQQHGMVCLDDDGGVVRDALLWNDTRSAAAAADLVAELAGGARQWARGRRLGAARRLHRHQAALAGRERAGKREADRRGLPAARLADLAVAGRR